jgi:hypothetical protein
MTTITKWLRDHEACSPALAWIATQPADATPAQIVAACQCGAWLLWLAKRLEYDPVTRAAAVRPAWLRAVRVYAPAALEAAGLTGHATRLRTLPDDVSADAAARAAARAARAAAEVAANAAPDAAYWSAARAARASAWAAARAAAEVQAAAAASEAAVAAAWAAEAEHALCATEVRAALPDLAERWTVALSAPESPT